MPDFSLSTLDFVVVGAYILGIVGLGLWVGRQQDSASDYFLAGRSLGWATIGLSMFASNISTSSLVGMAGEAYGGVGIAVFNYEWMAVVVIGLLVAIFLPFYLNTGIYTMPEFLAKRFDNRSRLYFSGWTIFLNITVDTAATLYAGALIVKLLAPGIPMWVSISALAVLSGFYIIGGGFKAVVVTEAVQAALLIAGSIAVAVIAWMKVPSWDAVVAVTPPEKLDLILPASDPNLPWPGIFTGVFILGFYFWVTNQFMVQRTLAARSLDQGRWGALFAGFLKLPVLFLMVLPGTFARVLYPNMERADMVFPTMVFDLLPQGVRALVLVGMLAALMSTVESTLNSAATLVVMDFGRWLRPNADSKQLARLGGIATVVFIVVSILWTPIILRFETLWTYLQSFLAYVVPPFVTLFVGGVFWKRATSQGAFGSILVGHVVSVLLFVLGPVLGVVSIPFLYIPLVLVAASALALVLISLRTPAPDPAALADVTWSRAMWEADTAALKGVPLWKNYRVQWLGLMALVVVIFLMF